MVQILADCPACGRICTWYGTIVERGGGTAWRISCQCTSGR